MAKSKSNKNKNTQKPSKPRGWALMAKFIDDDGTIYHRGKKVSEAELKEIEDFKNIDSGTKQKIYKKKREEKSKLNNEVENYFNFKYLKGSEKSKAKKEALLNLLVMNYGNVSKSCSQVDVDKDWFSKWINEKSQYFDPEFKKNYDKIDEILLDFSIEKLFNRISKDDFRAITYYLDNKGNNRGFGKDSQPFDNDINLNITVINKDEKRDKID
jgi:hypothetical protein